MTALSFAVIVADKRIENLQVNVGTPAPCGGFTKNVRLVIKCNSLVLVASGDYMHFFRFRRSKGSNMNQVAIQNNR